MSPEQIRAAAALVAAAAPPLTAAQRTRLAVILRPDLPPVRVRRPVERREAAAA